MENYSVLANEILKNDTLSNTIMDMVYLNKKALNLIKPDWEDCINNDKTYQDFNINAKNMFKEIQSAKSGRYNFQNMKRGSFQIIVAARCKFAKPFDGKEPPKMSVIVINSEPMAKIARAMTSDLGQDIRISEEFKFQMNSCSILSCAACKKFGGLFEAKGFKINKLNQPCIADTKIFDGKEIVNRFGSHMESMFLQQTFIAILDIKLDMRYDYMDGTLKLNRIGGKIQEMVAFSETKLNPLKVIYMGELPSASNIICPELKSEEDLTDEDHHGLHFNIGNEESKFDDSILDADNLVEKRKLEDSEDWLDAVPDKCKKQKTEDNIYVEEEYTELLI